MDWTVYWFMFPVCVVVASVAMFSGISGAALLTPVFLSGFPLLHVPTLTAVQAIGSALFLETFGFGSGVVGYARRELPDYRLVTKIVVATVPLGILGALFAKEAQPLLSRRSTAWSCSASPPCSWPRHDARAAGG